MDTFICNECKTEFSRSKRYSYYARKHGKKQYCSKDCFNKQQKTSVLVQCKQCNSEFYKRPSDIAKTKNNFCSRSCAGKYNNKFIKKRQLEGKCKLCNIPISNSRTYCSDCWQQNRSILCKPKNINKNPKIKPKSRKKVNKTPKLCKNCQKILTTHQNVYCSVKCSLNYQFQEHVKLVESRKYFYEKHVYYMPPFVKKYLRFKHGDKCSICNQSSTWNDKPLVLVADHINGIANDWSIDNLRLVCPNCDSQLPTFKSKNKNSCRPRKK